MEEQVEEVQEEQLEEAAPESSEEQVGEVQEEHQPAEEAEAAAYKPNYSFKVLEEEKEFDEWARAAVKDAETEKQMRELYEKAYGIDHVKADRQKIRDEYKSLKTTHDALNKSLDQLSTYVNEGDLHTFFKDLGISEQQVLQYAIERAQYGELPPEQRQQWDSQYESRQRLYDLERQNQELQQTYQQQAVSQRMGELESSLQRPEIANTVQSFDSRVGKPGAFMEEVIKRGQYYASLPEPQDISVDQAINEVLNLVGAQAAAAPAPEQPAVVVQQDKPVIPNIKGKGTSPTKKVPKSIADLRKMSSQL